MLEENWLKHRMSFEAAIDRLNRAGTKGMGEPPVGQVSAEAEFRGWYAGHFRDGGELWWYDTGGWEEMMGECGFAIVRETTMTQPLLSFFADNVGADTTEYTAECVVYLIAFGTGDPESGGHHWNFSRSFDDDLGVCTVREIQQGVNYGGIERFRLHRRGVECDFDAEAAEELGFPALRITFEIEDGVWNELTATATVVFRDCPFFTVER